MKDVAKALGELISATKCAAGKAADDPSMYQLKGAAKVPTCLLTRVLTSLPRNSWCVIIHITNDHIALCSRGEERGEQRFV